MRQLRCEQRDGSEGNGAQQTASGYFNHANFAAGEPPYLHTMAYVLEGLLQACTFTRSSPMLQAAVR